MAAVAAAAAATAALSSQNSESTPPTTPTSSENGSDRENQQHTSPSPTSLPSSPPPQPPPLPPSISPPSLILESQLKQSLIQPRSKFVYNSIPESRIFERNLQIMRMKLNSIEQIRNSSKNTHHLQPQNNPNCNSSKICNEIFYI